MEACWWFFFSRRQLA